MSYYRSVKKEGGVYSMHS